MIAFLTYAQYAAAAVLAIWGTVQALRNRPAPISMIVWAGGVLALLIVQLITGIVLFGQTNADPLLFFGYVLTAIILVPIAAVWGYIEPSKWGPWVLAAAGATVIVMILRMDQIWL